MKKNNIIKLAGMAIVLFAIFGVITSPAIASPNANTEDKSPYVRMHVINKSQFDFTIAIFGKKDYKLKLSPRSDKSVIVERGTYSFVMHACNATETGTINLNLFRNVIVPVCGGSALNKRKNPHNFDTTQYIKSIRMRVKNKTHEKITVYIRNKKRNYWATVEPKQWASLLVFREQYVYSFVACGKLQSGYYKARANQPLYLTCKNK